MKLWIIKVCVVVARMLYAPMKLRKTSNKILWLSRQSDEKSDDMRMLSRAIAAVSPDTQQVFRLKRFRDEYSLSFSYLLSLLRDMWELASAKVAITDSYSIPISCLSHKKELTTVQLWHALGAVKQFGWQSAGKPQGRDIRLAKALRMHKNYDRVIAPSKRTAAFFCEGFGCGEQAIVIASLPRVDVILDGTNRRSEFLTNNPQYSGQKLLLYLPTFRKNDGAIIDRLTQAFSHNEEWGLILSAHPLSGIEKNWKGDFSSYDLMKLADGIITDYSACAFEGSLLLKPLWFYVPDYATYKEEQGLNVDLTAYFPNACFANAQALVKAVESGQYDRDGLKRFTEEFVTYRGTDNTERLAAMIRSLL